MVWRAGTRYGDQGQFYYSAGDHYLGEWVEGRQVKREVQSRNNCVINLMTKRSDLKRESGTDDP